MTTLRDFVSEALVQFLSGIHLAQQDPDVGKYVAPRIYSGNPKIDPAYGVAYHAGDMLTTLKFDVAVTADSTTKQGEDTNVKGGIKVMAFSASAKMEESAENSQRFENVSRVQFAVHVILPKAPENKPAP